MPVLRWLVRMCFILLGLCVVDLLDAEDSFYKPAVTSQLCTPATYLKHLRALKCNQVYGQQLVDMYLNCGYNQAALREVTNCGLRNGKYCFDVADHAHEYQRTVDSLCFNQYGKPSCSESCQEALWDYRENVGCCINNLYNASDEPIFNDRTASNILWTACGITPIDGFCESTLHYQVIHNTMVCVYDEVVYRNSLLDCSPRYGQAFANLLRECGYSSHLRYTVNICGVNAEDRYCFEYIDDGKSAAAEVQEHCVETVDTECSETCQSALDDFKRKLGCCLNNLYNNEDNTYFRTTSASLWKNCHVKQPGFCKTTISISGGTLVVTSSTLSVVFIALTLAHIFTTAYIETEISACAL